MATKNSNIRIVKTNCSIKIEEECNKLLKQGYKLWGEMKIDYNEDSNCFIYHQLLSYDKELNQRINNIQNNY